jgi:hypothetical protein
MVRNRGYYTFISKWGMTSSTFTKNFLRTGEPFSGVLKEPQLTMSLRIKNGLKRMGAAIQDPAS